MGVSLQWKLRAKGKDFLRKNLLEKKGILFACLCYNSKQYARVPKKFL